MIVGARRPQGDARRFQGQKNQDMTQERTHPTTAHRRGEANDHDEVSVLQIQGDDQAR